MVTGMLLTFSYLSANLCAACLPDRSCPSASSVVVTLPLPSSLSCFVSLHNLVPSFSRSPMLSDAVLFSSFSSWLVACTGESWPWYVVGECDCLVMWWFQLPFWLQIIAHPVFPPALHSSTACSFLSGYFPLAFPPTRQPQGSGTIHP